MKAPALYPFPFQLDGIDFLKDRKRAVLADMQGLGKSPQAMLAAAAVTGTVVNVLVCCPPALLFNWELELEKWKVGDCVVRLRDLGPKRLLTGRLRFVLCGYTDLIRQVERLSKFRWTVVIADEAHRLKSPKSQTHAAFRKVLDAVPSARVWLLSGTPMTRSAADYWNLLDICQPGKWGDWRSFQEMFCQQDYALGPYYGCKPEKEKLLALAFSKVALRRTQDQVAKDLPLVFSQEHWIEDAELRHTLTMKELEGIVETESEYIQTRLRHLGLAKVPVVLELAAASPLPTVVFTQHQDVAAALRAQLPGRVATFVGRDSDQDKKSAVAAFQAGHLDYLVVNIAAGGEGITLHRSSNVIFAEQHWNASAMEQAIFRVKRIGQVASRIVVTHVLARDSDDETLLAAQRRKAEVHEAVTNGGRRI